MKTKKASKLIFKVCMILGLAVVGNSVFGQEVGSEIQYPIDELGGCKDKASCAEYCDDPKNTESCLGFAEKNNMMSKEEVSVAKNFIAAKSKGPGGCKSKETCEAYCDDIGHIDECISFAEKNSLMPPDKLVEAKKIQSAIANGVKPPACKSKKQCDAYCEEPDHMEECINFGIEAGFMSEKEKEDAKKMLAAVKKGIKPPPCRGKEACDEYCSLPENMETCMNFAIEAGFMNEEEKAGAQKMMQAVKKGINPPKCRGKEECDAYCGQEEHVEECINFAEAAGMMSSDDAAMARKTKGKGPGGCKGKEECEAFCNDPGNQETCFDFAKDNGMIPEEELKNIEEGKQKMQQMLQQAPNEMIECLNAEVGAETIEKLKTGTAMPSREIGDKMAVCGQKMGPPEGEGGMMQPGQPGPGGCTNPEECKAYCQSNPEECQKFQPGPGMMNPGDQMMPQQSGPGGCKTPEECKIYCGSNPDDCRNFIPEGQMPLPPDAQLPPPDGSQLPPPPEGQDYPVPRTGPGGCSSPEECQAYCISNPSGCQNFAPEGQMPPPPDAQLPPPDGSQLPPPPPTADFQTQPLPPDGQYPPYPQEGFQPPPCEGSSCYPSGAIPDQFHEEGALIPDEPLYPQQPMPDPNFEMQPLPGQQTQPPPEGNLLPPVSIKSIYNLFSSLPKVIFSFIGR